MKYSRSVLLQFHMLLNLCIILTTLLGTTLLATSTPIPANQEVKAQGNERKCLRTEEQQFEDEIVRGKCRERLVKSLTSGVKEVIKTGVKIPFIQGEALGQFVNRQLDNIIEDQMTAGNIAEAVVILSEVGFSIIPGVGSVAGIVARPLIRKASIEALKIVCRTSGCCSKE